MNGWASVKGLTTAALVLAISGCGGAENKPGNAQRDQRRSIAVAEKVVILEEFVSKTPGAKLYPQPARDLKINWKNINNEMALVDTVTGDAILSQDADRERRILYFAYVTKDRELVRIFSTQWGGGFGNYILDLEAA